MKKPWKTREVFVGSVGVGGDNPVRIQSMTTTDTKDVLKTVEQVIKLADAGCEIVRVTVQGKKEAIACEEIKNLLVQKGYKTPLVADIHFYPPAAMLVSDFVDKIRINPGNFADRRATFKQIEFEKTAYEKELERIEEKFAPLVLKCQSLKKAIRIGSNHGSLSDRIMSQYGDSPIGMVESALEYARICRKYNFHDIIFSMKSSNPKIMIEAYRLLVRSMQELNWDYPLHLGVTEAGGGSDGRIKSSVGIGSLLLDGIGDTIRVSLTEDPWHEIPPCKKLAKLAKKTATIIPVLEKKSPKETKFYPMITQRDILSDHFFDDLGFKMQLGRPENNRSTVDGVILTDDVSDYIALDKLKAIKDLGKKIYFIDSLEFSEKYTSSGFKKLFTNPQKAKKECVDAILLTMSEKTFHNDLIHFFEIQKQFPKNEIVIAFSSNSCDETSIVESSAILGKMILDYEIESFGLGLGLKTSSLQDQKELGFGIMQACRKKLFKTEYIACPGCGRTLFNLQEVSAKIKKETDHLPGVKIAVMGCIVNGPGEMADADFGYVGSKTGFIDLYVGKTCVKKSVHEAEAVEQLIKLIKEKGRWIEKPLV